jgi:hypothetical protein
MNLWKWPLSGVIGSSVQPGEFRFGRLKLQASRCLALLEALFESPQVYVMVCHVVMKSPIAGIVRDTQSIDVNDFVQLTSRLVDMFSPFFRTNLARSGESDRVRPRATHPRKQIL